MSENDCLGPRRPISNGHWRERPREEPSIEQHPWIKARFSLGKTRKETENAWLPLRIYVSKGYQAFGSLWSSSWSCWPSSVMGSRMLCQVPPLECVEGYPAQQEGCLGALIGISYQFLRKWHFWYNRKEWNGPLHGLMGKAGKGFWFRVRDEMGLLGVRKD